MRQIFLCLLVFLHVSIFGKIYDGFMFFNECELLRVRLEELYDVVDRFVVVEGTLTFSGQSKPLYFLENAEMFAKYKDKITHVVVSDFPVPTGNPEVDNWGREQHQRNSILNGLTHCDRHDIVFISDLDEIPNPSAIQEVAEYFRTHKTVRSVNGIENHLVCDLQMRLFRHQLNREDFNGWSGAKAAPYWVVKKRSPWDLKILHMYDRTLPKIFNAGAHFHIIGSKESWLYKRRSDSYEYGVREFINNSLSKEGFLLQAYNEEIAQYLPVPIDESFPKYIRDHLAHFESLGWVAH